MKIVYKGKRKAISPVLATVILIAITLIAAIAIAGFVFGLFGSFTSTAQVQASVIQCSIPAVGKYECQLTLTNSGNANTQTTASCSLTYGGTTKAGFSGPLTNVASPGAAQTITAGGAAVTSFCTVTSAAASSGSQVTGAVILANGGNALFSGTAS